MVSAGQTLGLRSLARRTEGRSGRLGYDEVYLGRKGRSRCGQGVGYLMSSDLGISPDDGGSSCRLAHDRDPKYVLICL